MVCVLHTPANAQNPPTGIQDEGGALSYPAFNLDCTGDGITCSHSGITGTINVPGNHGDGANCAAGEIPLGVDANGAVQGCYEPAEADISDLTHTSIGDCAGTTCFTGSDGDTLTGTGALELAPGGTTGVKVMDGGSPYLFTIGSGTARRRYSTVYDIYFDDWYSVSSNNAGSLDIWGGAAALQSYGARISVHGVSDTDDDATAAGDVRLATANNAGAQIQFYDKDTKEQCAIDETGMWLAEEIHFEGATADDFETTLTPTDATADRTITLPDATGTVELEGHTHLEAEVTDLAHTTVGDCSGTTCFTADGSGNSIVFEGATANSFETTVTVTDPTADRTATIPDATGNILLDSLVDTAAEFDSNLIDRGDLFITDYQQSGSSITNSTGSASDAAMSNGASITCGNTTTSQAIMISAHASTSHSVDGDGCCLQVQYDADGGGTWTDYTESTCMYMPVASTAGNLEVWSMSFIDATPAVASLDLRIVWKEAGSGTCYSGFRSITCITLDEK
jgi:hypothetical protein